MGLLNSNRDDSNWSKIRRQKPTDTLVNRDVYEDQQLSRTSFGKGKSALSYKMAAVALTILVAIVAWFFVSLVAAISSGDIWSAMSVRNGMNLGIMMRFSFGKFVVVLTLSSLFYVLIYTLLMKNKSAQDALYTTDDINQYANDQHIALPEEIQEKFDWFPDVGATSDVQFSSMISHMALSNKGIKTVPVARRAKENILDEDGEIVLYKGEVLRDDAGNVLYEDKPFLDRDFMDALFDASGLPKSTRDFPYRKFYDATKIKYNPGNKNRDKLQNKEKPLATVADLINSDWEFPYYEPQRPAGAYCVDTAPVNTMV